MEELDEEIDSLFVDIDDKGLIEGLDDDETLILDNFLPEEIKDRKRTWSDMDSEHLQRNAAAIVASTVETG